MTVQGSVPLHPPPVHPTNTTGEDDEAVTVTNVAISYGSLQSDPQSIPLGELVTVPDPSPASCTVSTGFRLNVAMTDFDPFIVTVHPPIPEHAPVQPANVEVPSGVAVRVTLVPES